MKTCLIAAALLAALLAACASGGGKQSPTASPSVRNPLGFPLYGRSSLIASHTFVQTVNAQATGANSVFAQGNGTYTGHEVIAESDATFADLRDWLDQLNLNPPVGFHAMEPQANPDQEQEAQRIGLDYAPFQRGAGKRTQGMLVIVMDPKLLSKRFGAVLDIIDRYRALPGFLRSPLDAQAQARYGMTVSQLTSPESPFGAALVALHDLKNDDRRGILVIDARKR